MYRLLGITYLTDLLITALNESKQEEAYRVYVTDCFYSICYSLSNPMKMRFFDVLHNNPVDERDGKEVAYERLERFGIKVVE